MAWQQLPQTNDVYYYSTIFENYSLHIIDFPSLVISNMFTVKQQDRDLKKLVLKKLQKTNYFQLKNATFYVS